MARSVLLLLTGAIAGGAAICFLHGPATPVQPPMFGTTTGASPASIKDLPVTVSIESEDTDQPGRLTGMRVAAYQQAVQATDAFDIESMIDFAAAAPRSPTRSLELKALLGRLAELDPRRAVDFAQSAYLETGLVVQVFEALARADSDAALVELASVMPAGKQRRIALAVLAVIGNDAPGVARLAAALPAEDTVSFEIDALLARAEINPIAALQDLIALNRTSLQSLALPRLSEIAARQNPHGALAMAESIEDISLRRGFQAQLLSGWAESDPDGVFEFFETAEPSLLSLSVDVFRTVARSDPDRLSAMVDQLPPFVRNSAKNAVMQVVAERDPVQAIAMLDSMPAGQGKENMLQVIAQAYGRENPELALSWVRSLMPPSDNALRAVLQGIVQTDVDRAIDVMIAEFDNQVPGSSNTQASLTASLSFSTMLSMVAPNGANVARLADRLLVEDNPRVRSMMSSVVSMWASRDSDAALSWTLANADRLDESALSTMAQRMADENIDLAISTLDRLQPEQRAGWINGLASQMVRQDADQAVNFVERYRGQPGYQAAFGAVVTEIARLDPVRAAGLLRGAPESSMTISAVFPISREWANRDPVAAARWAIDEIGDTRLQTTALNNIASTWAQRDGEAAERWIFTLTRGSARDAAIDGYLSAAAQAGQFQPELLEAYSSEAAAQQGASRAIVQMGRTDPEEARRLADLHLTDPAVRAQADQNLARNNAVNGGVFIANGNVIFLQ